MTIGTVIIAFNRQCGDAPFVDGAPHIQENVHASQYPNSELFTHVRNGRRPGQSELHITKLTFGYQDLPSVYPAR